jgi:hypothetical protein
MQMFRPALIGIVSLALSGAAIAAQGEINCGSAHKRVLDKLRHGQVSPERLAALNRRALRIYDACNTGDLANAKSLFENLDRWRD